MRFLKTFEGYFDPKTGKIINTGDFNMPNAAEADVNTGGDTELKFVKNSNPMQIPSFVKNPIEWATTELIKILDRSHSSEYGDVGNVKIGSLTNANIFANMYSRCFSNDTNVIPDLTKRLKGLLSELKTKDVERIKAGVKDFFDYVSPKLSDEKVASFLKSGTSFKEDVIKFEQYCSFLLD